MEEYETVPENKNEAPRSGDPLPVKIPDDVIPGAGYENGGDVPPQKKSAERALMPRIVSVLFSILFCGTTLLYVAAQAAESFGKLSASGVEAILEGEVNAGFTAVSEEPVSAETAEPVPDETEEEKTFAEETAAAAGEPSALQSYPIAYESLANCDLLTSLSNETAYEPDLSALLAARRGAGDVKKIYGKYGADAPAVLIVHTHGTEAYRENDMTSYTEEDSFRSRDAASNVVALGEVMKETLEAEGINTIHCTEMFDLESYRDSYSRSYAAVAGYLAEYPSISYVFDVHRDFVLRDDMTNVATEADLNGEGAAQVMIVVGTDEGGADHENWEDNLSFALSVQEKLASISASVPRKINLRSAAFNQGLCSGSLLLEIGSAGNTLDEATLSAKLTAKAIAEVINGDPQGTLPR